MSERFTRDEDGAVDEVVVGDPAWFHMERMRKRTYWMAVYGPGDERHVLWVRLRKDGTVKSVSYYAERDEPCSHAHCDWIKDEERYDCEH